MKQRSNVLLFMENRTDALENKTALGMKSNLGWNELTFRGLNILSKRLGNYLIKSGITKGDKLAILSESMPEWGAALFASVLSGAITIPLDIELTLFELTSILQDCKPKVLLVSNAYLETGLKLKETIDSIETIIILNDNGNKDYPNLYNIPDGSNTKWRHRAWSKTAFIIYTSGTTGAPKGVEITFKNAMAQVEAVGKCFDIGINDKFLSILPMNHLFELTVGLLSFLSKGTSIYYSQSLKPKDLFNIIQEKQITFMIVIPEFLELLKTIIKTEINLLPAYKRMFFKINYKLAKLIPFYSIRKLLFLPIHKKFGGKFKGCISGGAPLDITVGKFFERIGIRIFEGYGLSEASSVVTVNNEKHSRLGSIGLPIPGVQVKIDEKTGELMVKGDSVMKGYYNRPELTAEVITQDGWLHTGDIARIDKDGFVYITGHIKSIIALNRGENSMKYYLSIASGIRNEVLNLKEWLDYHLKNGVEHFYLYDNMSIDNPLEILQEYIDKGIVTYGKFNDNLQDGFSYMTERIKEHQDESHWIGYIDVDEFLVPTSNLSIIEILKEFEEFGGLGVNWVIYGSSGHIQRPEGKVTENYLRRSELDFGANLHIKSIVNPRRIERMKHSHYFNYKDGYFCVNESKEKIKGPFTKKHSSNLIRLHHYYCKSREDYEMKKTRVTGIHATINLYNDGSFNAHDRNEVFDDIILKVK